MAYNYGNYYGNNGWVMPNNGYYTNTPMNGTTYTQTPQAPIQQPMNYQTTPQMPQPSYTPQGNNSTGMNWVQGRAGANSFFVAPGQSALLMDSEESVLYVKSVDMTGRPMPLEVYDLVKRDNVIDAPQISQKAQYNQSGNNIPNVQSSMASEPHIDMSEYVKKSDVEKMIADAVNKALEG